MHPHFQLFLLLQQLCSCHKFTFSTQCKLCCIDWSVVPGTTYECMERNLNGIPLDIPNTTQSLDLSFNPLKTLMENSFLSLFALKFLDLTRCHIQVIEDDAFKGLCDLSVLILTANPIQFLGPRAFHDLISLRRLVAVEINLFSLDKLPIGHLKYLQELNLSHNHIDSLKLPEYFSHLLFLQWISLHSNHISSISVGDLDALSGQNLTLVLSNNDIKYIELNALKGVHFQQLSLRDCFESTTIMQDCLKNLSGSHINSLVLGEYRNKKKLNSFSKDLLDGLCHVPLKELSLINFEGDLLDTNILSACLNNISTVRLLNIGIKHVSPFPANTSIQRLEIKNSDLKTVPADNLSSLKELRVLRITHSPRRLLQFKEGFKDMKKLEILDFSENYIDGSVCWVCLMHEVPNLKSLNLSFNVAIRLPPECSGISKLEYLDFHCTRLFNPGKLSVFQCLSNLIYLDISYTHTDIMIECPFCGLDNLQVLKMAGNSFDNNQLGNQFNNLAKLQILDISKCELKHLSLSSLAHLHDLRELNVSHNKLLVLHSENYVSLHVLTVLDFHSNQLTSLTEKDLKNLPSSLKRLDFSQNLFDCSCDNQKFLKWAKEHTALLHAENVFCHNPMNLKGVPMVKFDLSSCQVSTTTVAATVSISLALVLSLILVYKYYFHLYYMMVLLTGDNLTTEKENGYDAFVIYSSEDQEWVKRELEETLEVGVPRFRLCLFYRDFLPGVSIITNIIKEGFQSSRKVIAVVSSHFLESRWCNFELEVAQSWQLLDSKASLVLIVLEGVDKKVIQQKLGLFRYLRRNTYLVWKDQEVNRHLFLRQLRVALLEGKSWTAEELKLALSN
uniref:Toll-like receptor 4 n=1 Tax=Varanus komodoensis TaxID=61221 RepID=A0A8D2LTX0_VARKO